ncbi:MAG TPA: 4Fe-4S ferredoxin, partial [Desulfobaccales bacterium]|nr:4Fe-4S ferredoxin [Desulfobaccales bacterium]
MDRREFIRLAGLSTLLGLGGFELIKPGRAEAEIVREPQALTAKRWAMVVNQKKLDDETAKRCIAACHRVHNVPDFFNPADAKDKLPAAVAHRYQIKWIWTDPFKN